MLRCPEGIDEILEHREPLFRSKREGPPDQAAIMFRGLAVSLIGGPIGFRGGFNGWHRLTRDTQSSIELDSGGLGRLTVRRYPCKVICLRCSWNQEFQF